MSHHYRAKSDEKLTPFLTLAVLLLLGVAMFATNYERIRNYRSYYTRSYITAAKYKFEHASKVEAAEAEGTTESVPVLLYHGIIGPDDSDGSNITIDNFIKQMTLLKENGYHTVSMEQYREFIMEGKTLPEKSFLLTFDDSRKDSYYPVQPILDMLDYRATMFTITGLSYPEGSRFYLSQAL